MDVMSLRRGLMMGMAKVRSASGEYLIGSSIGNTMTVTHNLNSNKIFFIAQLITEDYANFNATARYQNVLVYGATKEVLQINTEQTYSFNSGNQVHFSEATDVEGYPGGVYCYFAAADGAYPTKTAIQSASKGLFATSLNEVSFVSNYMFPADSRWLWRAYALD